MGDPLCISEGKFFEQEWRYLKGLVGPVRVKV